MKRYLFRRTDSAREYLRISEGTTMEHAARMLTFGWVASDFPAKFEVWELGEAERLQIKVLHEN